MPQLVHSRLLVLGLLVLRLLVLGLRVRELAFVLPLLVLGLRLRKLAMEGETVSRRKCMEADESKEHLESFELQRFER